MIADKFTILLSTDGTITALNCLKLVEPVEVKSGDIVEFFDLDLENKTCRCQIRREVTSMTTEPEKLARIETTQIPTAALDEELIGIPYLKEDIVIGETVFESVSGAEEKCRKINASYLTKSNARAREALEEAELLADDHDCGANPFHESGTCKCRKEIAEKIRRLKEKFQ